MKSMTTAPKPIRAAHLKPRRAPSLIIVRLIGPVGMELRKPLPNPIMPARTAKIASSDMRLLFRPAGGLFVVFLFNLAPNLTGDSRPDKAINEIGHERHRQD